MTVGKLLEGSSDIGCGQFKPQDFGMSITFCLRYCSISVCGTPAPCPSPTAWSPHGVHSTAAPDIRRVSAVRVALPYVVSPLWEVSWVTILTEPGFSSSSVWPMFRSLATLQKRLVRHLPHEDVKDPIWVLTRKVNWIVGMSGWMKFQRNLMWVRIFSGKNQYLFFFFWILQS